VLTAPRSPWQNPYVERLIGSIRRDCLDHFIIFNARHLKRTLSSYFTSSHGSRTHLGLDKQCPLVRQVSSVGTIVQIPHLGDGVSQKRGHFGAEVVPFLTRLLKRAFFSWRTSSSERPGAVKGAPLLGAAQRTLDGEDRSKVIEERKRLGEKLTKGAGAKVAPSLGATDRMASKA